MLSQAELESLAAQKESTHIERKASLSSKSKIEEAICAFANDLPGSGEIGIVLVGVDDKTGRPTGLDVTDELLLTLTSIRSDGNILPFPNLTAYRATLEGVAVAVVEVEPSPLASPSARHGPQGPAVITPAAMTIGTRRSPLRFINSDSFNGSA